nr:apolipoprotein N-acyltransferase [Actinomycetota bacterium]
PPPRPRHRAGGGRSLLRGFAPVAASLAGGLCVAASLPPTGAFELAPVGIALVAHSCAGRPALRRLAHGLAAGAAQFALGLCWALSFTAVGYVALVVVEAAFVAVACALSPRGRGRVVGLAGALVIAEWARSSWPFGGLPLGGVPIGQADGPLLALARVGGPSLVAGAVALAGTALAAGVPHVARAARHRTRSLLRPAAGPAAAIALVALSAVVATHGPDGGSATGSVLVAAVQGGGRRGLPEIDVPAAQVLDAQLAETARVPPGPSLVVWPEDAVSLAGPIGGSPESRILGSVARRLHTTLLAGVTEPAGPLHFRNEVVAWSPSGRITGSFEKVHPVPFGEYVPFRAEISHLVSLAAVPRDAVFGHGSGELTTRAAHLAVLISYETFFTGRGRSGVRAGGELLVVATNTASYATSLVPAQELAASRIQAVATGRDLVQAATTGYSAVVSRHGRVLVRSQLGAPAVVRARVPTYSGETLYDRFGDLPVLVLAAVAVAVGWALEERPGRARNLLRRSARGSASRTGPC